MKKILTAFTLAEILIVLVLIGVLSAILLPVAFQASPDENVMKFKKGNNTLATVIRELVTSDKYYMNGDLGTRADGTLIDKSHSGDITYFCETFADVLNTKSVNCSKKAMNGEQYSNIYYHKSGNSYYNNMEVYDKNCITIAENIGAEIITPDGIAFYQGSPALTFGISVFGGRNTNSDNRYCIDGNESDCEKIVGGNDRWFSSPSAARPSFPDENGFDAEYKLICMDVDGINKGEGPFAYGIRADGKILLGAKAKEWMEKSIQRKD